MTAATEILRAARKLLDDPSHWTQGVMARALNGDTVLPTSSPKATCWCSLGAIEKATAEAGYAWNEEYAARRALGKVVLDAGFDAIVYMNDAESMTHHRVLEFFDAAIERSIREQYSQNPQSGA